jgi:hypothetical protein
MSDDFEKPCHQELPSVEGPMIHRLKQQADRIEKLEAALREVLSLGDWGTNILARTVILEALEAKD